MALAVQDPAGLHVDRGQNDGHHHCQRHAQGEPQAPELAAAIRGHGVRGLDPGAVGFEAGGVGLGHVRLLVHLAVTSKSIEPARTYILTYMPTPSRVPGPHADRLAG
jgi:hypothetical protein